MSTSAILVLSLVAGLFYQSSWGQPAQKQSPAARANLTAGDFNEIAGSLIAARGGILNNDSFAAYNAINEAGNGIFQVRQGVSGDDETLAQQLGRQLQPLQNNIDNARDALRDANITQALRSLNNVDIRLLGIIQGLPPGEVEQEIEEE